MISSNAPNVTARRILIVLLAFAMAVAVAIAASIAPADAVPPNTDPKLYSAAVAEENVSTSAIVIFTNESGTVTQLAGSFSVKFPDSFVGVTATDADISNPDWHVVSISTDNNVIISADSGGDRISTGAANAVSVEVSWTDAPAGPHSLETDADQQAGGVFKGGNEFDLVGEEPSITVCATTQCVSTGTFNAEITCSDACLATAAPATTGEYDLTVVFVGKTAEFEGLIIVELTTTDGKAPNPGHAIVEVDGVEIEQCGVSGSPPQTNCFHVNRAPPGKNLEYTVIWDQDPNFKFR